MGKNKDRYKYLEIGLEWDSWTLSQLEKDAHLHQMSDQLAKLVALRLTEYYRLVECGVIVPGLAMATASAAARQADLATAAHNSRSPAATAAGSSNSRRARSAAMPPPQLPPAELEEVTIIEESDNAANNADAALDYFLDADEETEAEQGE